MLPIHRILCPTDFSPRAQHAFHAACALARDYKAQLVLLHVQPPARGGEEINALITKPEEIKQHIQQKLEGLQPHDTSVQVQRLVKAGNVASEIVHAAKETSSDVIVIGTHGHTALGRLLMGSVAESVLRKARCPVFMIKSPFPEEPSDQTTGH
jgi:nucleotide-binding universal stress UspA family protein